MFSFHFILFKFLILSIENFIYLFIYLYYIIFIIYGVINL